MRAAATALRDVARGAVGGADRERALPAQLGELAALVDDLQADGGDPRAARRCSWTSCMLLLQAERKARQEAREAFAAEQAAREARALAAAAAAVGPILRLDFAAMQASEEAKVRGTLVVRVRDASGLRAADRGGTSDPYVKLKLGGAKRQTAIMLSLNPRWDERHEFSGTLGALAAEVLALYVKDHDAMSFDDLLGAARLPLAPRCAAAATRN